VEKTILEYAIPAFILLMAIEYLYGIYTSRNTYQLNDSISSLSQGLISQAIALCSPFFQIDAYRWVFTQTHTLSAPTFWQTAWGWVLGFVIYDFFDYWLHRTSHVSAIFWSSHVVHHQSQRFNLSTGLRQESFYPIIGFVFFIPMALMGINPEQYAVTAIGILIYQFWIHTEHIGKLGWFDKIFSSPSNHRVHHAINEQYLDKNFGAMLIIWDRLFGTFKEETTACIYGTRNALNSWNPIYALFAVLMDLLQKIRKARSLSQRLGYLFKPPGWSPPENTAPSFPMFDDIIPESLYNPPYRRGGPIGAMTVFLLSAILTGLYVTEAETWLGVNQYLGLALIGLLFYWVGYLMEKPIR
jgi:sterol desaturase/sphingolipid hydroxylase (fatty acid hydroxylase superfamily)